MVDSIQSFRGGDSVRALVSGYPAPARARKVLVPVQVYVDDSRSDRGDRYMVLAGYVQTASNWARFSDAWYQELRAKPSVSYFKMREAFGLNGQFGGWSKVDRDEKVENLARIVRHFDLTPIHVSVSQRLVDEIVRPIAPYGLAGAYFHCFEAIILPLAVEQSKQKGLWQVPIDFIFDEQGGEGERAREVYRVIREQQAPQVRKVLSREPVFRDDKMVMPLQAADMLAWYIRRGFEEGKTSANAVPDFLIGRGAAHMAVELDESYLRRIAEGISRIPGASAMADKNTWKKYRKDMLRHDLPVAVHPAVFRRKQFIDRIRKSVTRLIGR